MCFHVWIFDYGFPIEICNVRPFFWPRRGMHCLGAPAPPDSPPQGCFAGLPGGWNSSPADRACYNCRRWFPADGSRAPGTHGELRGPVRPVRPSGPFFQIFIGFTRNPASGPLPWKSAGRNLPGVLSRARLVGKAYFQAKTRFFLPGTRPDRTDRMAQNSFLAGKYIFSHQSGSR